jgi:hypothetical protein
MRGTSSIKRRTVCAVVVITALAGAAPASQASADAPPVAPSASDSLAAVAGLTGLPAIAAVPIPIGVPLAAGAKGPTVVGDTFNGGTTVCVSTSASACSTNGS